MTVTTAAEMRIRRALLELADTEGMRLSVREVHQLASCAARAAGVPRPVFVEPQAARPVRVPRKPAGPVSSGEELSPVLVEALRVLAAGGPRRVLAARVGVPVGTWKDRVCRLYAALGVSSRVEALEAGRRLGVLGDPP